MQIGPSLLNSKIICIRKKSFKMKYLWVLSNKFLMPILFTYKTYGNLIFFSHGKVCPGWLLQSTYTAHNHLRREPSWGVAYITLACGHVCEELFLILNWYRRAQPSVGGAIPWAGSPGLYEKLADHSLSASQVASSILWFLLHWNEFLGQK